MIAVSVKLTSIVLDQLIVFSKYIRVIFELFVVITQMSLILFLQL